MKISEEKLAGIDSNYPAYIEGAAADRFLEDFGIRFAAGHWCAGDFADRFAPAGYNSDNPEFKSDIVSQMRRVKLAGIKGVEFHDAVFLDGSFRVDPKSVKSVKAALKELEMVPSNMNTNLFSHPKWKMGGITNADETIRKDALGMCLQAVDIAAEVGCESVSLWPGSDGWDYNFQVNYGSLLDRFIDGCVLINRKAMDMGLLFGIEAKLHEPREGNMVVSTSHKAVLAAKIVNEACGGSNMGIAVDYGHEQMYAAEPADTLYTAKRAGVPVINFHVNTAKLHSNDEDRVTGTGDNWKFADFCYAALDTGYEGWFGEDQFTYRMEPVKAMSLSRELFANIMRKALKIYSLRAGLLEAQSTGNAGATIDVVKKILV